MVVSLLLFFLFSGDLGAGPCFDKVTLPTFAALEDYDFLLSAKRPVGQFEKLHGVHPNSAAVKFKEKYEMLLNHFELLDQEKIIGKCTSIVAASSITMSRCLYDLGKLKLKEVIDFIDEFEKSIPDSMIEFRQYKKDLGKMNQKLKEKYASTTLDLRADFEVSKKIGADGKEVYEENVHQTYHMATSGEAKSALAELRICSGLNPATTICGKKSPEIVQHLFLKFKSGMSTNLHQEWEKFLQKVFLENGQSLSAKEFDVIEIIDGKIIFHEVKSPEKVTYDWTSKVKKINTQYDLVTKIQSAFTPEIRAKFGCCIIEQQLDIVDNFTPEGLKTLRSYLNGDPVKYRTIRTNFN